MRDYELSYTTISTLGDFGPWISSIVLKLPTQVRAADLNPLPFNVYVERHEQDGTLLMRQEAHETRAIPSRGYLDVLTAYPCDAEGRRCAESSYVALELPECRLTKTIEGSVLHSRFVEPQFRITQTATLAGSEPVCGLVYTTCERSLTPQLKGWNKARMQEAVDDIQLEYGYFTPNFCDEKPPFSGFRKQQHKPERAALIIWLHGAGEGGHEVERAYTGNRVTALSQAPIQTYFDGAAWVLVPQCPSFWMDDGDEQLGRSNQSIYSRPLKALIDEFICAHQDQIDPTRIIIGGLSNGGFMTIRMCIDYPDFFAGGLAVCAPFFKENQGAEVLHALHTTPLWFVHAKGDELVNPADTALPLYHALIAQGSRAHFTYFDRVEDLTGVYREPDGRRKRIFNHGVWIHVYNDFCRTELDGTQVMLNSEPVGIWEWAARLRRTTQA
ncbi:prolyl oligopeptidase family serine peptidase [Collinsella sp. zg1085]|uniref:prolyl oligopeptidase family serine peptidase n=1 Tax=Collinsella sp. zg1085 TaxID=2844380 RepID=UPI001C0D2AFE|nr:prolyl oligopeptidase family serine peptidase [Collinsella sp. zg1085]QWT17212.1 prolyl oligopeptidase family serine peptidase [Collinsella sp. zg1085]